MQMQKKNRSISKGVIEAKDKLDLLRSNQQFSPNVSKRTVGINLNTFLSSKPGNIEPESVQSDNFKNNHNNTYYNNQSTNILANNMTTNFQKYTKNFHLNQSKTQLSPNYQVLGNSVNISTNNTNNTFLNNNSNINNLNLTNIGNMTSTTNMTNNNSKNLKLESIKNINTVIKKLKYSNAPNKLPTTNKNENSNTKLTNTTLQKKIPNIPTFQSSNLNNLNKGPLINLKTSTCFNQNQNIYSNFSEMSPSTSIANLNMNESKFENTPQKDLFKLQDDVKGSNANLYLGTKQNDTKDTKKNSTQETNDNSSNNSTIKNYKHSNSSSINGLHFQVNKCFKNTNIENPEDLHFFYVKMFQTNKEYVHKFEKEE